MFAVKAYFLLSSVALWLKKTLFSLLIKFKRSLEQKVLRLLVFI